jgi:hypothetical protein
MLRPHSVVIASSSRSQLEAWTAMVALLLTWQVSSIGVRRRPSLTAAIVTHLVTRSCCTLGAAPTISLGMSAGLGPTCYAPARRPYCLTVSRRETPQVAVPSGTQRARPGRHEHLIRRKLRVRRLSATVLLTSQNNCQRCALLVGAEHCDTPRIRPARPSARLLGLTSGH